MSSLTQMLLGQLDGDLIDRLAGSLSADPGAVKKGATMALPMLLSGIAKNASSDEGAQALDRALEKDHDGSVLDNLLGASGRAGDGAGILKHVLGDRRDNVAAGIANSSGLDRGQAEGLLVQLAPLVMGLLGKKKRSEGLGAAALAGLLSGERGAAASQLGGLASLLDQDGDGNVADDVLGGLAKGLGGKLFGG